MSKKKSNNDSKHEKELALRYRGSRARTRERPLGVTDGLQLTAIKKM